MKVKELVQALQKEGIDQESDIGINICIPLREEDDQGELFDIQSVLPEIICRVPRPFYGNFCFSFKKDDTASVYFNDSVVKQNHILESKPMTIISICDRIYPFGG